MKVMLVNGSPNEKGCTYRALQEVQKSLLANEIQSEFFWVGNKGIAGCLGCGSCKRLGECFRDDPLNAFLRKAEEADGFVFGSPVHFAGISGDLSSFMDRAFYAKRFAGKPAAGIVSCRRGGAGSAFDRMNKYFTISGMPIVSSQYWNAVHGNTPEEVEQDLEGLQIMRTLGNNMAWLLKCIELGKENGLDFPKQEERQATNFIR